MNKYITVSYDLYTSESDGKEELAEQAPKEHPFFFISELGMTLPAFEERITPLSEGDTFDFTLTCEEAYGPHVDERVIEVSKSLFTVDGKFMADKVFEGNILPLVNEDGYQFYGLVLHVGADKVKLDCNNLFAGKTLHYKGQVLTSRTATDDEITEAINGFGQDGCGGCGGCGGCDESCEGGCGGGHCGGCH